MDGGESGGSTNGIRAELNVVKKTMRIPRRMEFSKRTVPSLNCRLRDAHSAQMPAALMIGHHFFFGALVCAEFTPCTLLIAHE